LLIHEIQTRLLLDEPARLRVSKHRVVPDPAYAIRVNVRSDSGIEEAPAHSREIDAPPILLYESNITH
jgi:hypothetical protein